MSLKQDPQARGWQAIDDRLHALYPDQPEPLHIDLGVPALGDALAGVSVLRASQPAPHWHYVTYGLSDLFDEHPDAEVSGFGLELTFRLLADDATDGAVMPPTWPVSLLHNLAGYVSQSGHPFVALHSIDARGPIQVDSHTKLTGLLFVVDPDLGSIESPNGRINFIQAVGITQDELRALSRWQAAGFARLMIDRFPKLITVMERESMLANPDLAEDVEQWTIRDGSSQGTQFGKHFKVRGRVVEIGASQVESFLDALALRLPYGRDLVVVSDDAVVRLEPGESASVADDTVHLTDAQVKQLTQLLKPLAGDYQVAGFEGTWRVIRSEITDESGNVVEVIG